MSSLLMLTSALRPSADVLPALALLPHSVKILPAEGSALLQAPDCDLILVDDDATLIEVGRLMVDAGVRHVVVGDGGAHSGILSVRDVLAVLVGPGGPFPTPGAVRS